MDCGYFNTSAGFDSIVPNKLHFIDRVIFINIPIKLCFHELISFHSAAGIVSEDDYNKVDIERIDPMPDWNYIIRGFLDK